MTDEKTSPKSVGAVTVGSGEGRSVTDRGPSHQSAPLVSSRSEAIIKEGLGSAADGQSRSWQIAEPSLSRLPWT